MIECQICKRVLGRLNGKHLKSHGLSAAEYREKFPGHLTCEPPPVSDETRAKMSASRKGATHSEEAKAKIGAKHRGKTRTPEEIDKWRASYAEYIKEHGSPMTGKDRGAAFREKMREIARNRDPALVRAKVEQMWAARRGSKATPEQRERYTAARLKYIEDNPDKLPSKMFNTRPERELAAELDRLQIPYIRNKNIKGKLYDFVLFENTIIEIDGPYHWNYKMYGNRNMPDEERMALFEEAKKNDIYKNELAKQNGYKIYRIKVEGSLPLDWKEQLCNQGCVIIEKKTRDYSRVFLLLCFVFPMA